MKSELISTDRIEPLPSQMDRVSVIGHVVRVDHKQSREGWVEQKCNVSDSLTGNIIEGLPCACMNLKPGQRVEITIARI